LNLNHDNNFAIVAISIKSTIYWLLDNKPPITSTSGIAIYQYLSPKKHKISYLDEGAKLKSILIFNK